MVVVEGGEGEVGRIGSGTGNERIGSGTSK